MKKNKFINYAATSLIIISMSSFLLTGCNSNNASAASNGQNGTSQNTKFDPEQMKQRMEDSIKPLVTKGTITQAQSDKIVEALTSNIGQFNGQRGQRNQQGNTQKQQSNTSQDNTAGNNKADEKAAQKTPRRNSALDKLVSDGTITKAQEDAVMQLIGNGFGRRNTNSQNNTSTANDKSTNN